MSDTTQLPTCSLCGAIPYGNTKIRGHVICPSSRGRCGLGGVMLSEDEWRRLHGPRLAQEHSETMHALLALMTDRPRYADAIRAALAALGEDKHV